MSESEVSPTPGSLQGATGVGTSVMPAPAARPRRRVRAGRGKGLEIAVLSGPAILIFGVFVLVPVVLAAYYGFYSWHGYGAPTDFVGLRNYRVILGDPEFRDAVKHNFEILALSLLIQGPVAIGLALLLNRKVRGRSLIRVLVFAPWVVSEVIAGIGWGLILGPGGALNTVLNSVNDWLADHLLFGLHVLGDHTIDIDWLGAPHVGIWTLMLVLTWKYVGFAVILMMAGLQNIPEELYEAATLDGASYWQTQRWVTLPLLGPTVRIWAFLSIIGSLQLFDIVNIMWKPDLANISGTSTMATYMYNYGKAQSNFGYGSAVAVVLFIISLVVAVAYQRLVLRRDMVGAVTDGGRAR